MEALTHFSLEEQAMHQKNNFQTKTCSSYIYANKETSVNNHQAGW